MMNRDSIRASMDAEFATYPEWVRLQFLPFRETLTLLFNKRFDDLARDVIQAIPQPAGKTLEELNEFDAAKSGVLAGIDSLILDFETHDPLRSPESIALRELAEQRRNEE